MFNASVVYDVTPVTHAQA